MQPNVATRVYRNQVRQKMGHDPGTKERTFSTNDMVFVRNFSTTGHTWLPGIVIQRKGSHAYLIKLADDRVVQRHIEHIRSRSSETAVVDSSESSVQEDPLPNPVSLPTTDSTTNVEVAPTTAQDQGLRRSSRVRQPPVRLSYGPSNTSL